MVQKQTTPAPASWSALTRTILNYSIGPMLILSFMVTLKHPVNCHSHPFRPIRMPPQLKQSQTSQARQQTASAESSFASVQPTGSDFTYHSKLIGTKPNWPYQIGWSHVLRPPWLHLAKNLVAAPVTISASNWAPSARHLPNRGQQQSVATDLPLTNSAMPPTDRRVASSQTGLALVQQANSMSPDASPRQSRKEQSSTPGASQTSGSSRSHHWRDPDGKLLICYYATKQTAPYWPKESREFVVTADQFNQAATDFFVANQNQQAAANQLHQSATMAEQLNDEQLSDSRMSSAEVQQKQRRSIFASNAGGNGGRLVVIAPNLMPALNQSIGAKSDGGAAGPSSMSSSTINELGIDQTDSKVHMFHQTVDNNRRRTIVERNDSQNGHNNGATLSTISANQSIGKQLALSPGESNFQATQNNGGQTGGNAVVFEHNLHDPHNNSNNNKIRRPGGPMTSLDETSATFETIQRGSKTDSSITNIKLQPPQLTQSSRASSILGTTSLNSPTPSLTVAPLAVGGGSIQNRNFVSEISPINSSEQLNQFYYYYNLPKSNNPVNQGWKNTGFNVNISPTVGGSNSQQQSQVTNRFKSPSVLQSPIISNSSPVQRGKSLQVSETNLDELNKSTRSSVLSGSSVSPNGEPLWPSLSSTSSLVTVSSLMTTKSGSSLVFSRQPSERLPVGNRPKLVTIAGDSFSLDGQRYASSVSGEGSDATGSTRVAPSAASAGLVEPSLAESPSVSKTTPAMSPVSSSSISPGSNLYTNAALDRPPPNPNNNNQQLDGHTPNKLDAMMISGANNRNHQQPTEAVKQTSIGLAGSNSLSASLVSSPLSTMFDVFGAASQYLMRLRPSSLISPASFAAFNSIGEYNSHHNAGTKGRANSSSLSSLVSSLPFGSLGGHVDGQRTSATRNGSSQADHKQSAGGFLSRLSFQLGQSHQQQRREEICGRTIQTPERRIIGGEGAKYGEFPYQVHIKIAKHQCGGALIDRQSIVTAAHCVYHFITRAPVNKLQIVIGAYDIEDEQYQELPPQYFKVNKVKLHPNFRFSASHPDRFDVAILKLDKPVKYTDNVLPVCLPGKDLKYDNMVGTVTGFGKTDPSLSNRYGTRLLQKVDVPIIENSECERWHRTRGIDLKIFPEMMCAGYEDGLKDACVGDSGGPLVVKTPTGSNGSFRWTLAGITSAGFGCAQSRQPGIYHRVSHTVDWILDNLD